MEVVYDRLLWWTF